MMNFLSAYTAQSYALMRIVTGFLFLWHGTQKLLGFPPSPAPRPCMSDCPPPPATPDFVTWIAGPIELIGGALVMLGLFTRPAAFLCSGLMAAAYWMAHGTNALLPILNKGELAALYCFVFLLISTKGSGIWSLDSILNTKPSPGA